MAEQQQCPCCGQPWREKVAPVQGYAPGIPWSLHLEAYAAYSKKWSPQPALIDLEGRNCRGGFGTGELDEFVPGWRERVSEIHLLRTEVERLKAAAVMEAAPSYPEQIAHAKRQLAQLSPQERSWLVAQGNDGGYLPEAAPAVPAAGLALTVVGYRRKVAVLNSYTYEGCWHWSTKTGDGWEPIYGILGEGESAADAAVPAAGVGEAWHAQQKALSAAIMNLPCMCPPSDAWQPNLWKSGYGAGHRDARLAAAEFAAATLPAGSPVGPVGGAVRMLTVDEFDGLWMPWSSFAEAEAIQRKFCEVNNLPAPASSAGAEPVGGV